MLPLRSGSWCQQGRATHLHEEDKGMGIRVQEALAVHDFVQAAHGGRALQQCGLDSVWKAKGRHLAAGRLVRRVAVQNLHNHVDTLFSPLPSIPCVLNECA